MEVRTQTVAAAGDRIALGGSLSPAILARVLCSGGAITLTSTPNIDRGAFDGQILYVENDKDTAGGLTFSDESGVPGSGMRLVAATLAMNARDVLMFIWSDDSSAWIQAYARLNVL